MPGQRPKPRDRSAPAPDRPSSVPRWATEEIRATARPGRADAAVRALDRAIELLEETDEPASMEAAASTAEQAKQAAPRSPAVREVLGIALYRAGRFQEALRELQAYRRMTGRMDQNHLIADAHRALGAPDKAVDAAREAMAAAIPEESRAEAAIVGASALADLSRFAEALALLRSLHGGADGARPFELRLWYVAGDILERAGRPGEAAAEFDRVVRHDPEAFDAAERLARLTGD
jgi:tetratricopeptide (TPR) repeat protein